MPLSASQFVNTESLYEEYTVFTKCKAMGGLKTNSFELRIKYLKPIIGLSCRMASSAERKTKNNKVNTKIICFFVTLFEEEKTK